MIRSFEPLAPAIASSGMPSSFVPTNEPSTLFSDARAQSSSNAFSPQTKDSVERGDMTSCECLTIDLCSTSMNRPCVRAACYDEIKGTVQVVGCKQCNNTQNCTLDAVVGFDEPSFVTGATLKDCVRVGRDISKGSQVHPIDFIGKLRQNVKETTVSLLNLELSEVGKKSPKSTYSDFTLQLGSGNSSASISPEAAVSFLISPWLKEREALFHNDPAATSTASVKHTPVKDSSARSSSRRGIPSGTMVCNLVLPAHCTQRQRLAAIESVKLAGGETKRIFSRGLASVCGALCRPLSSLKEHIISNETRNLVLYLEIAGGRVRDAALIQCFACAGDAERRYCSSGIARLSTVMCAPASLLEHLDCAEISQQESDQTANGGRNLLLSASAVAHILLRMSGVDKVKLGYPFN